MPCCEKCSRTHEQLKAAGVLLDVYNDFDDQPGNLICDDCLPCDEGPRIYVVERPEGYYHCPVGTFD